jgi:hypothetical protein
MASIGDLRGRVVITNASSQVLKGIKSDIEAIANASKRVTLGQYGTNLAASTKHHVDHMNRTLRSSAAGAAGAGFALRGIVDATKDFQESKFGFGFATITDYIRDGRLELDGWKKNMDAVALKARASAKDFGTNADVTMRAREETEKLGFKGKESDAIFGSAVALHLSEPRALASGEAAKFMGTVYRAYAKQRDEMAKKLGADGNDPAFVSAYVKSLGAKAAVAGAESALGPADIVEGMRQFAPQWAAMGVDYELALAMLAHGSNYGFRAPELGTAFKSMMTKIINPTAQGLRVMNDLGIDRSQFMMAGASDPVKGATRLNNLLSGGLFRGKGGGTNKATIVEMLETARRDGTTGTADFQNALTQEVQRMLQGKGGYEGRIDDITQAVSNSIMTPNSVADLPGLLKKLRDSGATVGQIAEMFEGRHVARYTPTFQFYEKMIEMHEKLKAVDGTAMDAVVDGRKASETGKTDQMFGSFKELLLTLEQAGGLVDKFKDAIIGLNNALTNAPKEVHMGVVGGVGLVGGLAALGALMGIAPLLARGGRLAGRMTGIPWALGATAGAGAAGLGWMASRLGMLPRHGVVGPALGLGAHGAAGLAGMQTVQAARSLGMLGGVRAIALGAGRILIPGLGIVSTAAMGYGAYQGYKETGTVGGAVRGAFGLPQANAAEGGIPNPADAMNALPGGGPGEATRQSLADMRMQLQATDLTSEGARIMETLAAGIRSGSAGVLAAMDETVAGIRERAASASGAGRVNLNTGPTMSGAR